MGIDAGTEWEVRYNAPTTNAGAFNRHRSGATTDYTQSITPTFSYTDLVVDSASTNIVTSAARPFISADIGNHILVSGGTGFTLGLYEITAIQAGNKAVLDRTIAPVNSAGGIAVLGGATHYTTAYRFASNYNRIWVKDEGQPHTLAASLGNTSPGGANGSIFIFGYQNTRGDFASKPVIKPTANNVNLVERGDGSRVRLYGIIFDGGRLDGLTGSRALVIGNNQPWGFYDCEFRNFSLSPGTNAIIVVSTSIFVRCRFSGMRRARLFNSAHSYFYCIFEDIDQSNTGTTSAYGDGSTRGQSEGLISAHTAIGNILRKIVAPGMCMISANPSSLGGMNYVSHNILHGGSSTTGVLPSGIVVYNNFGQEHNSGLIFSGNLFLNILSNRALYAGFGDPPPIGYTYNAGFNVGTTLIGVDAHAPNAFPALGATARYYQWAIGNLVLTADPFVDSNNGDYRLKTTGPEYNQLKDNGVLPVYNSFGLTNYKIPRGVLGSESVTADNSELWGASF